MSVKDTQIFTSGHVANVPTGTSASANIYNVSARNDGAHNYSSMGMQSPGSSSPAVKHSSDQYILTQNGDIVHTNAGQSEVSTTTNAGKPTTESSEIQHEESFPPFNVEFFASHILWLVICFGFFYFFMSRVVLPRIGGTLEMRRDRIASDLDQAARLKSEVDEAETTYHKTLEEARNRAKSIAAKATKEAKEKADAERKSVEGVVDRKLADAEARIIDSRDKALSEADKISAEIAADVVKQVSGKKIDSSVLARAIDTVNKKGSANL